VDVSLVDIDVEANGEDLTFSAAVLCDK
jgi:hypothetical protein